MHIIENEMYAKVLLLSNICVDKEVDLPEPLEEKTYLHQLQVHFHML